MEEINSLTRYKKGLKEMKKNKQKVYIIYEIDQENDFINIYESKNRENIGKWLNINVKHIDRYITKDLYNINKTLKDNKYFIFKDYEQEAYEMFWVELVEKTEKYGDIEIISSPTFNDNNKMIELINRFKNDYKEELKSGKYYVKIAYYEIKG